MALPPHDFSTEDYYRKRIQSLETENESLFKALCYLVILRGGKVNIHDFLFHKDYKMKWYHSPVDFDLIIEADFSEGKSF